MLILLTKIDIVEGVGWGREGFLGVMLVRGVVYYN